MWGCLKLPIGLVMLKYLVLMLFSMNVMALDICHSGSWYNPETDGQGFSIEVGNRFDNGKPQVVVYYYTYDSQGFPIFLVGIGEPVGDRVRIDFKFFAGPKAPEINPDDLQMWDIGYADFTFYNTQSAYFEFRPNSWFRGSGHVATNYSITKLFDLCQ